VLIYDAETYELLKDIEPPPGGTVTFFRQIEGGPIYISGLPGGYKRYDRESNSLVDVDVPTWGLYDPESGMAFGIDSQRAYAYDTVSGRYLDTVDISKDGEGMGIFSLGLGPDGCIYGGVYNLLHLFRYDPKSGVLEDLGNATPSYSGEYYSFCTLGGKLYMASYTYSVLTVYDPSLPWNPGSSPDSNPRTIGPVGEEQYRPPALVAGSDGKIYIGSIPAYGKLGGALSIYDPEADTFEVHRNIIPDQSILSLVEGSGGILYGGSGIRGGGGTSPIAKEAHFFGWDMAEGKLVLDIVPKENSSGITALVAAPDGKIYGSADSYLFVYDPELGEIIKGVPFRYGSVKRMTVGPDGLIYGITGSSIFRMLPISNGDDPIEVESLCGGGVDMVMDDSGDIYFGSGTDLYVLRGIEPIVLPKEDSWLYRDGLDPGWEITAANAEVDLSSAEKVTEGTCQKITFGTTGFQSVEYVFKDPSGFSTFGYGSFDFSFNPGDAEIDALVIGTKFALKGEDFQADTWAEVSIPLEELGWSGESLSSIRIWGRAKGSFYIDNVRFVARRRTGLGWEPAAGPSRFSLFGYPNPFNSAFTIEFELPCRDEIELSVYDVCGRRVRTLLEGVAPSTGRLQQGPLGWAG